MNKLKSVLGSKKDQIMDGINAYLKSQGLQDYEIDQLRISTLEKTTGNCRKVRRIVKYTHPTTGKVYYRVVVKTICT